jgi:hypothetical protein
MDPKEKFLARVEVAGSHWLWTGKLTYKGYGWCYDFFIKRGELAHRSSYRLFVGPIPPGVMILHNHEGMKACVCPDCLYPGDQGDNARDFLASGLSYAPKNPSKKLNPSQVLEIRASSLTSEELAVKYDVTDVTIRHVKNGKTWRNLPFTYIPGRIGRPPSLSDENIQEIRASVLSARELAVKFCVSSDLIYRVRRREVGVNIE